MIYAIIAPVLIGFVVYYTVGARKGRSSPVERTMSGSPSVDVSTVLAIARLEARRLWRAPLMLAGVVLVGFGTFIIGMSSTPVITKDMPALTFFMFPLAGMALLATNLATLRARRDGTEELYGTMPVGRDGRTVAHLVSTLAALGVGLVVAAGQIAYLYSRGAAGTPNLGEFLTAPLLVLCAAIVGVSAARLIHAAAGGLLALLLMGVLQGLTDHFGGAAESPGSWFSFAVLNPELWPHDLLVRRPWPHLLYLAGLGAFAAAVGFLRDRRDKAVATAISLAVAAAAVGGYAQSRPRPDAEWDRIAASISSPEQFQTCRTYAGIQHCAYPNYEHLLEKWRTPVESVVQAVPSNARSRVAAVRQRPLATDLWHLPEQIRSRVDAHVPSTYPDVWADDGAVHPTGGWCTSGSCELSLATLVAARTVGLPAAATPPLGEQNENPWGDQGLQRYDASGESRALIALWLGARATPSTRKHFIETLAVPRDPEGQPPGSPTAIEGCDAVWETGTAYGQAETLAAATLLKRDDDAVLPIIRRHWETLTDPATKSSDVAALFDLPTFEATNGIFSNC